jgi:hypothetical protein
METSERTRNEMGTSQCNLRWILHVCLEGLMEITKTLIQGTWCMGLGLKVGSFKHFVAILGLVFGVILTAAKVRSVATHN